jgi:predicted nucleic acid-binding protein
MILVDTSVWIRSLMNRAPFGPKLRDLLLAERVVGHELVYGELLIGDVGGRQALLAGYEQMTWTPTVPHRDVVAFVRDRKIHGRGLSWIDVHLLASALVAQVPLWTADAELAANAAELGVAYEPFPHRI